MRFIFAFYMCHLMVGLTYYRRMTVFTLTLYYTRLWLCHGISILHLQYALYIVTFTLELNMCLFCLQLRSITHSIETTPFVRCLLLTCTSTWMHRWKSCKNALTNATRWYIFVISLQFFHWPWFWFSGVFIILKICSVVTYVHWHHWVWNEVTQNMIVRFI